MLQTDKLLQTILFVRYIKIPYLHDCKSSHFFIWKIRSGGVDLESKPKHGTINKDDTNETAGMLRHDYNFMFALQLCPVAFS